MAEILCKLLSSMPAEEGITCGGPEKATHIAENQLPTHAHTTATSLSTDKRMLPKVAPQTKYAKLRARQPDSPKGSVRRQSIKAKKIDPKESKIFPKKSRVNAKLRARQSDNPKGSVRRQSIKAKKIDPKESKIFPKKSRVNAKLRSRQSDSPKGSVRRQSIKAKKIDPQKSKIFQKKESKVKENVKLRSRKSYNGGLGERKKAKSSTISHGRQRTAAKRKANGTAKNSLITIQLQSPENAFTKRKGDFSQVEWQGSEDEKTSTEIRKDLMETMEKWDQRDKPIGFFARLATSIKAFAKTVIALAKDIFKNFGPLIKIVAFLLLLTKDILIFCGPVDKILQMLSKYISILGDVNLDPIPSGMGIISSSRNMITATLPDDCEETGQPKAIEQSQTTEETKATEKQSIYRRLCNGTRKIFSVLKPASDRIKPYAGIINAIITTMTIATQATIGALVLCASPLFIALRAWSLGFELITMAVIKLATIIAKKIDKPEGDYDFDKAHPIAATIIKLTILAISTAGQIVIGAFSGMWVSVVINIAINVASTLIDIQSKHGTLSEAFLAIKNKLFPPKPNDELKKFIEMRDIVPNTT